MAKKRIAILVALAMLFSLLLPSASVSAAVGAKGDIPVPAAFRMKTGEENTAKALPNSLAPGQIWVHKTVVDNEDGTFDITFQAKGATYTATVDKEEVAIAPLADDTFLVITETIGEWFSLVPSSILFNGDADIAVGTFNTSGNQVTWSLSQEEILDELQTCTFTVEFSKTGWDVGTKYYTGEGDNTAAFEPRFGNPYYYKTDHYEWTTGKTLQFSWNQGSDNGLNNFSIRDTELGVFLDCKITGNNTDVTATFADKTTRKFVQNKKYCTSSQTYESMPPTDAKDGQWGMYWIREDGKVKTLQFWFKGLEEPGVITRYDYAPGNNGGNQSFNSVGVFYERDDIVKKTNFPWDGDSAIIKEDLPNRGWVQLFERGIPGFNFYKLFLVDEEASNENLDQFTFKLYLVLEEADDDDLEIAGYLVKPIDEELSVDENGICTIILPEYMGDTVDFLLVEEIGDVERLTYDPTIYLIKVVAGDVAAIGNIDTDNDNLFTEVSTLLFTNYYENEKEKVDLEAKITKEVQHLGEEDVWHKTIYITEATPVRYRITIENLCSESVTVTLSDSMVHLEDYDEYNTIINLSPYTSHQIIYEGITIEATVRNIATITWHDDGVQKSAEDYADVIRTILTDQAGDQLIPPPVITTEPPDSNTGDTGNTGNTTGNNQGYTPGNTGGNTGNTGNNPTEPPVLPFAPPEIPLTPGNILEPQPDGSFLEFNPDGVALGRWTPDTVEPDVWVFEEYVPLVGLGALPNTGGPVAFILLPAMGALLMGAGLTLKKREENQD